MMDKAMSRPAAIPHDVYEDGMGVLHVGIYADQSRRTLNYYESYLPGVGHETLLQDLIDLLAGIEPVQLTKEGRASPWYRDRQANWQHTVARPDTLLIATEEMVYYSRCESQNVINLIWSIGLDDTEVDPVTFQTKCREVYRRLCEENNSAVDALPLVDPAATTTDAMMWRLRRLWRSEDVFLRLIW